MVLCGQKLSEVYSKILPRQICIIVAVTNAIITGGSQNRERESDSRRERRGCALTLPSHATCNDTGAKLTFRLNFGTKKHTQRKTTRKQLLIHSVFLQYKQAQEKSLHPHTSEHQSHHVPPCSVNVFCCGFLDKVVVYLK